MGVNSNGLGHDNFPNCDLAAGQRDFSQGARGNHGNARSRPAYSVQALLLRAEVREQLHDAADAGQVDAR